MDASAFLETYRDALAKQVGTVRFFLQDNDRPLTEAFVELTVIEDYRPPENPTQEAFLGFLDASFRERRELLKEKKPEEGEAEKAKKERQPQKRPLKPDELLQPKTHAVIVGAPGCGKTTLLRYLANKTLIESNRLPVFLELKTLTAKCLEDVTELHELVFEQGFLKHFLPRQRKNPELKSWFEERLERGDVSIFLDGLDEILKNESFTHLGNLIENFVKPGSPFAGNNLIVSTRPYAFVKLGQLAGAKACEITPLDLRKIEDFVLHLFDNDKAKANQLVKIIREHSSLQDMAGTPLLLCVLAALFRQGKDLLQSRTELYDQIVCTLVIRYEGPKRVKRFAIADEYGLIKRNFLSYLAFERVFHSDIPSLASRLIFTIQEIEKAARHFPGTYNSTDLTGDVIATPLLREVGRDTYAFSHLTILEYLVAAKLAELEDNDSEFKRYFRQAYFNRTLIEMEILPMTLGLIKKPNEAYDWLETLPESINLANLRLRARGLAFVQTLNQKHLSKLTESLKSLILGAALEKSLYYQSVTESFASLTLSKAQYLSGSLIELLNHSNWSVRAQTTTLLGQFRVEIEGLERSLLEALKDKSLWVRARAAEALGQIGFGSDGVMLALVGRLRDKYSWVRGKAARALGKLGIGSKIVVTELIMLLRDGSVANDVIWALVQLGVGNKMLVNELVAWQKDKPEYVREGVVEILTQISEGETVIMGLLGLLKDKSPMVQVRAAGALVQLGVGSEPVVIVLMGLLRDRNSDVTRRVVEVLGQLRMKSAKVLRTVVRLLRDEDSYVRASASKALGQLGVGSEEVVRELIRLLWDGDRSTRKSASLALGQLGVGSDEVVRELIGLLRDGDWSTRESASLVLVKLGVGSEVVMGGLVELLRDRDQYVRRSASEVLGKIGVGSEEVVRELIRLLWDGDWSTRASASEVLGKIGVGSEEVVRELIGLLRDGDWSTRKSASEVLGKIGVGSEEVVRELIRLLWDGDRSTRKSASLALGQLGVGSDEVVRELIGLLRDGDWSTRKSASLVLVKLGVGSEVVMGGLVELLRDRDQYVRRSASEVLGKIGVGSEEVVRGLVGLLQDKDSDVRASASEALGKIGVGSEEVGRGLVGLLRDEDWHVQGYASKALVQLGLKDSSVLAQVVSAFINIRDVQANLAPTFDQASDEILIEALQLAAKSEDPQVSQKAKEWLKYYSPKAESPAIPRKPVDRTELLDILLEITPVQFNLLVTYIKVKGGHLPGKDASQSDRAVALIEYAEAPGGCGLESIRQNLDKITRQKP